MSADASDAGSTDEPDGDKRFENALRTAREALRAMLRTDGEPKEGGAPDGDCGDETDGP